MRACDGCNYFSKRGETLIQKWLKAQGYTLPGDSMRAKQQLWLEWYRGFVRDVHKYSVFNGQRFEECFRRTLGMAKVICEDFGSLLVNEHVQITSDDFPELADVLERNEFFTRMNRLAELTMALGTGALVEFLDAEQNPVIDYIRADMVYPLSWDCDRVTECAFASRKVISMAEKSETVYYVQLHKKEAGGWRIRNVMLDKTGNQIPLPEGMQDETPITPVPMFQIVRPNTINTAEFDSPLGAAVFADSLEQLADCDIVWDSYINEFILGKKRLMVPMSLAKMMMHKDANGNERLDPLFDPNDALFYVYEADTDSAQKPIELDMNLRTDAHEQGLQRCIDTLSKKCGLGVGRYRFDQDGVKTATEVISAKSDLYQSLKRHEKTFGDAIIGMVKALAFLSGKSPEIEVSVQFDDSIIEDANATLDRCIKRVNNGLMSKTAAIMEIDGVDEAEAVRRLEEIKNEERMTQQAAEDAMYTADTDDFDGFLQ